MKKIILALSLVCAIVSYGQRPEILTEVYELAINDRFEFDDYEIRFVDVLSDSRCPKAVMCIVAGEAKVALEVYKRNKKIMTQDLSFTPTIYLPNNKGNVYNSEFIKITGVALFPYPRANNPVLKSDYRLKLVFEEIVE